MLVNGSKLLGVPILSLHVGGPIARTTREIVNPHDLQVMAFELAGPMVGGEYGDLLDVRSVREYSAAGMVVDSADEFVGHGEVVRLDEIMRLNFQLTGMKVETKRGTKLGKVVDFVVNTADFRVMQLIVRRPALKALMDPELLVGRSEVVEITDYKIIVRDEERKVRKMAASEDFIPNFVNPFREGSLAHEMHGR